MMKAAPKPQQQDRRHAMLRELVKHSNLNVDVSGMISDYSRGQLSLNVLHVVCLYVSVFVYVCVCVLV